MNDSLNQSVSVKRLSKKIKKTKVKYINFTICLLIVNFISFLLQKYPEITESDDNKITTKNIFLFLEDFGLKAFIIISLIRVKVNSIILCSIMYFVIAIVMIFYLIFNKLSNVIPSDKKIKTISMVFFIFNILLFCSEGVLLAIISQLTTKEKRERNKEKYGFQTGEDILRNINMLTENSFG